MNHNFLCLNKNLKFFGMKETKNFGNLKLLVAKQVNNMFVAEILFEKCSYEYRKVI